MLLPRNILDCWPLNIVVDNLQFLTFFRDCQSLSGPPPGKANFPDIVGWPVVETIDSICALINSNSAGRFFSSSDWSTGGATQRRLNSN